eukprot:TRINITY_DN7308_c0_g1_i2.p1 TRINITY_DN7308_c0_g1~~TRINITY_DN7308_c0_g1_i2.p1  ORF type:complete len:225 (+),score=13.84 TRINITY_DN7308_c0_g1_i2:69-743(+)
MRQMMELIFYFKAAKILQHTNKCNQKNQFLTQSVVLSWCVECAIAGGIGGIVGDIFPYPLDTLKTQLQASQEKMTFRECLRDCGSLRSLFHGMDCAFSISFSTAAVFFVVYEPCVSWLTSCSNLFHTLGRSERRSFNFGIYFASAALGEFVSLLVRNPLEVLKQNLQASSHPGVLKIVREVWKVRGIRGFYTGLFSSIVREIPFSCIQLPVYEFFLKQLSRFKL